MSNRVRLLPSQLLWNGPDYLKSVAETLEEPKMFGRQVTMKLKANSAAELSRLIDEEIIPILRKQQGFRDEVTFIAPERSEAIAGSFWDSKQDADAYNLGAYIEVLKKLSAVVEETPTIKTFEFAKSTFHKLAVAGKIA